MRPLCYCSRVAPLPGPAAAPTLASGDGAHCLWRCRGLHVADAWRDGVEIGEHHGRRRWVGVGASRRDNVTLDAFTLSGGDPVRLLFVIVADSRADAKYSTAPRRPFPMRRALRAAAAGVSYHDGRPDDCGRCAGESAQRAIEGATGSNAGAIVGGVVGASRSPSGLGLGFGLYCCLKNKKGRRPRRWRRHRGGAGLGGGGQAW